MKKLLLLSALALINLIAFAQAPKTISKTVTDAERRGHPGGGYESSSQNMGPPAMNPADFRMAFDAMNRQHFDDDRLRIGRQVLRGNYVSAAQVRDLSKLFTFDRDRLSFAKDAYLRVVDPQDFYIVNDAFVFSSSMRDLDAYVSSVAMSGGGTYTGTYGGMNGQGHGPQGGGHGHGHGQGNGYNGNQGQNGYYGSSSSSSSGQGVGMTYSGGMNSYPAANLICESEFAQIGRSICDRHFESDRLLVAKQAIGCRLVTADQVRRLMGHFTFESTKLEFAKWAYSHTYDQGNYYVVNDAFTFSSSIRDLDRFIRGC